VEAIGLMRITPKSSLVIVAVLVTGAIISTAYGVAYHYSTSSHSNAQTGTVQGVVIQVQVNQANGAQYQDVWVRLSDLRIVHVILPTCYHVNVGDPITMQLEAGNTALPVTEEYTCHPIPPPPPPPILSPLG
jgi:hypothetical protein